MFFLLILYVVLEKQFKTFSQTFVRRDFKMRNESIEIIKDIGIRPVLKSSADDLKKRT